VVVEIGFATHAGDQRKLLDEASRQAIAAALAKSIREAL